MTRNIVLICLDTVRKDYFDRYAPRLLDLADVSFEQCRAASAWSVPSHASILTGKLPHQHGIHTHNRDFTDLKREDTFLSRMSDYSVLGASANVYASSTFGFDGVFDSYSDVAPHRRFSRGMDMEKFIQDRDADGLSRFYEFLNEALHHPYPMESLANGALFKLNDLFRRAPLPKLLDDGANIVSSEGLRKVSENSEPFFLFTNFMDAHGPVHHVLGYDKTLHSAPNTWTSFEFDDWDINVNGEIEKNEEHLCHHRELYSAAIDYLDRKVSEFIKTIQNKTDSETTFIITADHGENLAYEADNRLFGHTSSLTESLLHVPLYIVNPPEGYEPNETRYFSHLQLGELIVGLSRDQAPDVFRDRIPAELIGIGVGGAPQNEEEHRYWDRMLRCVYEKQTKYVWDSLGQRSLYEIDSQRPCWQGLVDADITLPSWTDKYFETEIHEYKTKAQASEQHSTVDEATRSRLEELGYL